MTPGEREIIEAIENNISKIGFRCNIRFLYIAKHEEYAGAHIASMFGFFRQFSTQNLNGFKPNSNVSPNREYLFPKQRNYWRRRRLLFDFKRRYLKPQYFIFNTEELATLYHFPGMVVQAPMTPRIGAKKAEPPPSLPTE